MGSNGHEHEEGIEGVDLGCGLRRVGVGMKYVKTKVLMLWAFSSTYCII